MKTMRALTLITFLAGPMSPVAAQDTTQSTQRASKDPEDLSDALGFLIGSQAGLGVEGGSPRHPTGYGGFKIGGPLTLDVGYDRIQSRGGLSAELSTMLPVTRFPGPQSDRKKNYFRIYVEPGVGYRTGCESSGGYLSLKFMVALLSDVRLTERDGGASPFFEIQGRLPMTSAFGRDTRVMFGMMYAICHHCGLQ